MTAVRAIIVHREQPERVRETVAALLAQRRPPSEIVIVDNASSKGTRAALDRIDGVRILDAGRNAGFGGGANVGLREWLDDAHGEELVVLLPHDARPAADCLARMVDAIADVPDAGLVSAEYGVDEVPVVDPFFGALSAPATRGPGWQPADYAHGTFLLLRRACLEQVGLFDESYFAYCEEADLALRAKAAGWRSGIVWGAVVANPHQGSSPPLVDYLMVRNTIRLVDRHFGSYNATIRLLMAALSAPWHALRPAARSPWFDARARLLAVRDVLLGRSGPPPVSLQPR